MANVCIKESTMREIGNAIRIKTGKKDMILPKDMASEIESIKAEDTNLVNNVLNRTVTNVYIDAPIDSYAFESCKSVKPTFGDKCTKIGSDAFRYCYGITEINTNKVAIIEASAFSGARNLIKADLPNVAIMYNYAFYDNSNLQTIIIRSNAICVLQHTHAFYGTAFARGEGYIYVPKDLIDDYKVARNWSEFANQFRAIEDYPEITGKVSSDLKTSMKNVLIDEDTMISIGNAIRSKTGKEDMILPNDMPNKIKNIGIGKDTKALSDIFNKSIKEIHIDAPVKDYFFMYCEYVKPTFGDKCTSIGKDAFKDCFAIEEINTNKVTYLGYEAFSRTRNLIKADLPNVTSMDRYVFEYNNKLETVILRANKVCSLSAADIFYNTPTKDKLYVYVPQALIEQYKVATNWITYADLFRAIEDYPDITGVSD